MTDRHSYIITHVLFYNFPCVFIYFGVCVTELLMSMTTSLTPVTCVWPLLPAAHVSTTISKGHWFQIWVRDDCPGFLLIQEITQSKLLKVTLHTHKYTKWHYTHTNTQSDTIHTEIHKVTLYTQKYTKWHYTHINTQSDTIHTKIHKVTLYTQKYTTRHYAHKNTQTNHLLQCQYLWVIVNTTDDTIGTRTADLFGASQFIPDSIYSFGAPQFIPDSSRIGVAHSSFLHSMESTIVLSFYHLFVDHWFVCP